MGAKVTAFVRVERHGFGIGKTARIGPADVTNLNNIDPDRSDRSQSLSPVFRNWP